MCFVKLTRLLYHAEGNLGVRLLMLGNFVKKNTPGSHVNYKWWVLFAVSVGLFTSVFDHGSINVALPSIADQFNTDLPTTQWIVIGYGLTIAALLLPMGRLSDMLGRKKIYLLGFMIFATGGFLAAISPNIELLIGTKIVQGVGSAMTQGTSMAMVISAFGDKDRGRALGLTMSVVGVGAVVGRAIGGFLVDYLGWEAVLYTTAGLGVVSLITAMIILDSKRSGGGDGTNDHYDWLGATFFSSHTDFITTGNDSWIPLRLGFIVCDYGIRNLFGISRVFHLVGIVC